MDIEYRNMLALLGGKDHGEYAGHELFIHQCYGMGKVNAALAAQQMILQQHPDCIISSGLAGGISPEMKPRDIAISEQCVYHDVWCGSGYEWGQVQGLPAVYNANPILLECAKNVESSLHSVVGLTCSGDLFVTSPDEIDNIRKHFPTVLSCDMESAAIAQTCYIYNIPFLAVRVISDTPGDTDDHEKQWFTFLQEMGDHSFQWISHLIKKIPQKL